MLTKELRFSGKLVMDRYVKPATVRQTELLQGGIH
jgi:hypothetical protein